MPSKPDFDSFSGDRPSSAATNSAANSESQPPSSQLPNNFQDSQAATDAALGLSILHTSSQASPTFSQASSDSNISVSRSRRLWQRQALLEILILLALGLTIIGVWQSNFWFTLIGTSLAFLLSAQILRRFARKLFIDLISPEERQVVVGLIGLIASVLVLMRLSGWDERFGAWYQSLDWSLIAATSDVLGAVGQILIAILAVYIAWRQYVISKDLTIQQNNITQQQTIDSYFQGISELVLDEEGLLEDWPQERAIAEGRTAAILSSIDAGGKAKVLRFLSRSRLLSPLQRDRRLGRAILDGKGGYAEDRNNGIRVVDLDVMLAGANLAGTDLRWTDLSDINLIRANLRSCDLVKANLARTILCGVVLAGSDMMGVRLFYGSVTTASPRTRADIPDYQTGAYTGAVLEGADLTGVLRLSTEQRYYCCAWGGATTRATVPGGCAGIPDLLTEPS